jgi:hypothetical protein
VGVKGLTGTIWWWSAPRQKALGHWQLTLGKTTCALGKSVREALTQGPVVCLTEQPLASFRVALARAGLLEAENLLVHPLNAVAGIEWSTIARTAATEKCKRLEHSYPWWIRSYHFAAWKGTPRTIQGQPWPA